MTPNTKSKEMEYPKDYNQKDIGEFYQEAIDTVRKMGYATASLLQRRFKIGYAKAAHILDMMDKDGITELQENFTRKIL